MQIEQNMKIPAPDLMDGLKLTVTITDVNALRIRIWIGSQFIRLAALVIGCGLEIKEKHGDHSAKTEN